ncbi:uncharacterized protein C3orf20 homolog isoform X1 [Phascolarctos cinereus]|uniref:Uncharacterized protein C3orf20 homolog isoform X1 n=1 Tax=Phascolarctos cinereus TaxID=38626 RepID=A0A6P5M0U7_PHACI|nr:uncharacterized protein C3orf20 homolog isoform X1 [Phascolarctos cinereus]
MTTSSHNLRNSNPKKNTLKRSCQHLAQTCFTKLPSQVSKTRGSGLPFSIDNENIWFVSQLLCPVVLRNKMRGEDIRLCRCSSHSIPHVTDLEFDFLINNQISCPEQITVICVYDSSMAEDGTLREIEELYAHKNRTRNMPCIQSRLDPFRLLKYNISSADEFNDRAGSLLVYRHNVAPGMFLMYIQGKLLFANYVLNGYSTSAKDLQKQIVKTKNDYQMGYHLPSDFRVRNQNPNWTVKGHWPRYTAQFARGVTGTSKPPL